jgi:two-component system LytT family response regulator
MSKISALIIEDEIENIELVKLYLSKYFKEIELIYSTTNLKEGIELYLEHRQQILFLDIDLGKGTTIFEFLDHYLISSSEIIFITSFEQFAIKAINIGYVSAYITKPLKIDEFVNAVSKTIDKINKQKGNLNIENNRNNHSIAVASTNKVDLIPIEELICCTAKGKYTVFETSNKEVFISSRNLGEYQNLLNSTMFFRIHYKHIVNIKHVISINKLDGNYCVLSNGKSLPISKRRLEDFNRFIKLKF